MTTKARGVGLFCLLVIACAGEPEPPPPVQVEIGLHVVAFRSPEGWDHLDHRLEHEFQRGLSRISLSDLGPATPEAYLREMRHAHRLFRDHRFEDARAHLADLDLTPAFTDEIQRKRFMRSWWTALNGGRSTDTRHDGARVAWHDIMEEVERLPSPELADLVKRRFPTIETAAHREIAERIPLEIDGRSALRVETWDRLSHDHRRSWLFVLNEGNLLLLRMELGNYSEMVPAFETLVGSLAFWSASATS